MLLDECLRRRAKFLLAEGGHDCRAVQELGFQNKKNGELLALAESQFDVFVTIDRNMRFQQNLSGKRIAIDYLR